MFGVPKSITILNKINNFVVKDKNSKNYRAIITPPYTLLETFSKIFKNILLLRSDYWKKLTKNAAEAVNQYPSWRITEKKVQKSANLHDWLKNKFSLTDRETEIIKKILSEIVDII